MGQVVGAQLAVADATGTTPGDVRAVVLTGQSAPAICGEIATRCGVTLERIKPATAVVLLLAGDDPIARELRAKACSEHTTISDIVRDIVSKYFDG